MDAHALPGAHILPVTATSASVPWTTVLTMVKLPVAEPVLPLVPAWQMACSDGSTWEHTPVQSPERSPPKKPATVACGVSKPAVGVPDGDGDVAGGAGLLDRGPSGQAAEKAVHVCDGLGLGGGDGADSEET